MRCVTTVGFALLLGAHRWSQLRRRVGSASMPERSMWSWGRRSGSCPRGRAAALTPPSLRLSRQGAVLESFGLQGAGAHSDNAEFVLIGSID